MKDLVTEIAKALVDIPDEVTVREVAGRTGHGARVARGAERSGQGDRKAGPNGPVDPDLAGRGRHEIEPAVYAGDSGIARPA